MDHWVPLVNKYIIIDYRMNQSQNIIKRNEDEKKELEKRKFNDGLNEYFRYKDKYESLIKKEKTQIINMEGLSWKEKRIEFMKIKAKCINCKRPVGSVFSIKVEKDGRHLIALCGDRKDPCPFHIDINLGLVENIRENLNSDEKTLNEYKRDIIFDKNDMLFGYITEEEAVEKFDTIKEQVSELTKIHEFTLQTYLGVVDNEEKKSELEKLQLEFYNNLDNFNSMINQYNSTKNNQLIIDAVDLYVKTMQPRAAEIMNKKYNYSRVEYNEDDNTFHLIQTLISHEKLEWDLSENGQKVIKFKTGLETNKKPEKIKTAFSSAIPDIREKEEEKFKLNTNLKIEEESESEDNDSEEEDNESEDNESEEEDNESEEEDNESEESDDSLKPLPKIKIHPSLLEDGTIAASEANRLNFKIELVKGELIAKNANTGETYKVTAGRG
jgi:hypothetical protein